MNKIKKIIRELTTLDMQTNGKVCKIILAIMILLTILLIICIKEAS